MKKAVSLIVILSLILSAAVAALGETQYAYVSTPTSDGTVYVRKVAGAGQPIAGVAQNGDTLIILKRGNTWHRVRVVRTGVTGYMYGRYITFIGSSAPDPTPAPAPAPFPTENYKPDASATDKDSVLNLTGVISSSDGFANLRWGPGTGYPAMGPVNNGTEVWVLERNGSWYRCRVGGKIAYISQNLVKLGATYGGISGKKGVVRSSDGFASVRTGPGKEYNVTYTLNAGQNATAWTGSGDWLCLSGYSGWGSEYVHRTLVRFYFRAQTTGNVYLRSGPAKTYSSLGVVNNGTRVTLLATDGNFARVDTGSRIAYLSMKYLSVETAL